MLCGDISINAMRNAFSGVFQAQDSLIQNLENSMV